jgi:small subunit ribosomal protein S2e
MADAAPRGRGGFGSRGDRGGDRRGRGRGRGRRGGKQEEKEWQPVTKLGRLVKAGKITSMEQIYLHSLPIKEYQIVDFFLPKLKDEVMKVRTRRKGIANWDRNGNENSQLAISMRQTRASTS